MSEKGFKHIFEPTDNSGYCMECVKCGRYVTVHSPEDWDEGLNEICPGTIDNGRILELSIKALNEYRGFEATDDEINEVISILMKRKNI